MINIKTLPFCTVFACIFFTTHLLFAQDRFVTTTGDDDFGLNDCSNIGSPCFTIQNAINQSSVGDVIQVSAGIYRENLVITQSVSLQGANQGISGFDTRAAETIIQPGTTNISNGIVIDISSSNVTIDGFTISGNNDLLTGPGSTIFDALQGIYLNATGTDFSNLVIKNNVFANFPRDNTPAAGNNIDGTATILSGALVIEGSSNGTNGHTIKRNLFHDIDDEPNDNYSDQLGFGIILQDSAYADVSRNKFSNVGGGILVLNVPKLSPTDSLVIDTCYFNNNKAALLLVNGPTNVLADSLTIENSRAFGIRLVKANNENIDFHLTNSSITETGNALTNYSGIAAEAFAGSGILTVQVDSSLISNNQNRGLTFRGDDVPGNNIGIINNSTIMGNAYNRSAVGNGYGVIVNAAAQVTINESILSNASSDRTAISHDGVIGANSGGGSTVNGGILIVRSSSMTTSAGNIAATASGSGTAAQIDASGNWWGSTIESIINSITSGPTDFTPWLQNGADQNNSRAGFQSDISTVNVGLSRGQTGTIERIQEVIENFRETSTLIIQDGIYNETPEINRDISFDTNGNVQLDQFTMNGTGVQLTVNGNFSVDQSINLTEGNVSVNTGSAITLTTNAADITELPNSRIEGTLSYQPTTLMSGNSLDILGVNFIGGNNELTNLSISRISGIQGQNVDGNGNETINVTWQLTANEVPDNWTVNFSWPSQFDNGTPISNLTIWRNGGSGFEEVATGISASGDPRLTQNIILNSFSDYTIADASVLLPVTLESFSGSETLTGTIQLNWSTLTEEDSDFFQIEKSLNGIDFFELGSVKASGNSNQRVSYQFEDSELTGKEFFYRLKMVDFDDSFEYSKVIYVPLTEPEILLFPNPANTFLNIPLASKVSVSLALFDQSGRMIFLKHPTEEKLDISTLDNGLYFYQLKVDETLVTGKLIVQ